MEAETPAEAFARWLRAPGAAQKTVRWFALIPGAACIYLAFQLTLAMGIALVARSGDQTFAPWTMNMLNAALLPFVIIRYGTPIAPSSRRLVSCVLALVAITLVVLARLAFELAHPLQAEWRYLWLALAALLGGASAWFGIRAANRPDGTRPR